jgi:hypothetical protein
MGYDETVIGPVVPHYGKNVGQRLLSQVCGSVTEDVRDTGENFIVRGFMISAPHQIQGGSNMTGTICV